MAATFAARYRKDPSMETLKAKPVHQKSISRKESRHNEFNKGRQFAQTSRNGEPPLLEETGEGYLLRSNTKSSQKSSASAKSREQEHLEMVQRYKAEKELQKLKDERDAAYNFHNCRWKSYKGHSCYSDQNITDILACCECRLSAAEK